MARLGGLHHLQAVVQQPLLEQGAGPQFGHEHAALVEQLRIGAPPIALLEDLQRRGELPLMAQLCDPLMMHVVVVHRQRRVVGIDLTSTLEELGGPLISPRVTASQRPVVQCRQEIVVRPCRPLGPGAR